MLVTLPHIFQSLPDVPDTEKLINKECRILNQEQKHFDIRNSVCEILRFRERIAFQGLTTNEVQVISFCRAYGLLAVVRAALTTDRIYSHTTLATIKRPVVAWDSRDTSLGFCGRKSWKY